MISIIIPTYNRAHLIKDAVDSVIQQSFTDWELIIVDDGSTDNTAEVLSAFNKDDRITYTKRPESYLKGANACRNYGYQIAKGDYIKWLDSDDYLHQDCLALQLDNLKRMNSQVDICQSEFFNPEGRKNRYNLEYWGEIYKSSDLSKDLIYGKIRWQTAAGLWNKKDLPFKPFNESIQNSQEWLFHIEMASFFKLKFSFTEMSLVFVRYQTGSMSHSKNQDGTYFYNAALARYLAILKLYRADFSKKPRIYLLRKYFRAYLFSLYKGSGLGFLKLTMRIPEITFKTFF